MSTERASKSESAAYHFGTVAIDGTGRRVVVTELSEDDQGSPAVIVAHIGRDSGINLILRASGTVPVGELQREEDTGRWPVEMVTECIVRGELGRDAGEAVRAQFRAVFEAHAQRPGLPSTHENIAV